MNPILNIRSMYVAAALLLCASFSMTAQIQNPAAASAQRAAPSFQQRYPRYAVHSGDSFDLNFEYSPEFNQTVTVEPDGFITLRGIGDLHVSGLTLLEVQHLTEAKYASILKQPNIAIIPKDLDKNYFIATGEVAKPGKYEIRGETTVVEALAMAGGFTQDRAKHSEVVLFRREGDTLGPGKVMNLKKMLESRNLSEDVLVQPGDLLYVPQNKWSKMRQLLPTPGIGMEMAPGLP